jgi:hypothetical protein
MPMPNVHGIIRVEARMSAIKATVHNGQIVADNPIDLPEGTRLIVVPMNSSDQQQQDEWDNSPQGIASWLEWYRSLEPLVLTQADIQTIATARKEQKEWELAHANDRAEKLRRLWE